VLFLSVGVVGMFAGGLIRSRRAFASVVVPDQAPVTADRSDPVRAWLTRRNQRVRSLLVFAARFPFIAGPAIGAVVGYGISNQRSCVTYRNSDRCSFYVPGHHTVTGGAGWGLLAAVLIYVGALEVRRALIRASDAQAAQEMHTDSVKPDAPILDQPQGSYDDDLILVRTHDRTGGRIGKHSRRDQHAE